MPHHRRRDTANLKQTLQRAHLTATQAHVKLDLKDSRITLLENDKITKDAKLLELETDKASKDTAMADLTARLATLENGNGGNGGGGGDDSMTSEAVSWRNLTEINLSGEKLTNGDFSSTSWAFDTSFTFPTTPTSGNYTFSEKVYIQWLDDGTANFTENKVYEVLRYALHNGDLELENDLGSVVWVGARKQRYNANNKIRGEEWEVVDKVPTNWSVHGGTLNQAKLAQGIIKGSGGQVAIRQTFSQNIASGTKLVIKVTSDDDIVFTPIKVNGQSDLNNDFTVLGSDGYAEYTTQTNISGFKVSTVTGLREFSSVSIFQGAISGGTVQAYAGGGLEKISGTGGWNAGASSVQKIDGNSDGYVQFQWNSKSVRIGLKYSDVDFNVDSPYLHINFATNTVGTKSVSQGDWFRIRHYASTNEIKYQRKETVYGQNSDFVFETASGSNYNYPTASRPLIISLDGTGNLTIGQLYKVNSVRSSDQALYFRDLDGNAKGWHGQGTRGVRFEVAEEVGQDYVTFYTEPTLTNGNDLYVDASFYHVDARINDVTIVR